MKVVYLLFACSLSSTSDVFAFKFLNSDVLEFSLSTTTGQRLSKVRQAKNKDGTPTEQRQQTSFTDDTIKQMIESYNGNTGSQPTSTPPYTGNPTKRPTVMPTPKPTANPTKISTAMPTPKPTANPTKISTAMPTPKPNGNPTKIPTRNPTTKPATNGPSSKPTGSNATLFAEGLVSEESIYSDLNDLQASQVQGHNSTQTTDTIKSQPNLDAQKNSLPILIGTIGVGLLCLVAVGVAIMAWVMGGPEEDDWSRSDRAMNTLPSVYSPREKSPPRMDIKSYPSPRYTIRENNDQYPNDKKKSIWRKKKDKSAETRSSNIYPKEQTAVAEHGSWWERLFDNSRMDRFLDNTINKVC